MRNSSSVQLLGPFEGAFEDLPAALRELGLKTVKPLADQEECAAPIRMMAFAAKLPVDELRVRKIALNSGPQASVAVLCNDDPSLLAMAAAIDCDDVLIWPISAGDLTRRLENLIDLARRRAELLLRLDVVKGFNQVDTSKNLRVESRPRRSGNEKRSYLNGIVSIAEAVSTTELAKDGVFRGVHVSDEAQASFAKSSLCVLIAGRMASSGGRIAEMLKPAQIVFAGDSSMALTHLHNTHFDLVLADPTLDGIVGGLAAQPVHTRFAWVADAEQDRLRGRSCAVDGVRADDWIRADTPNDILRARLNILRDLAVIERDLRLPAGEWDVPAIVDGETGLFNAVFWRAYLNERMADHSRRFETLDLVPADPQAMFGQIGLRHLTDWLRKTGRQMQACLSCDDLVFHLGGGRFRAVLQDCDAAQAEEIANRLLGAGEGWFKTDFNSSVAMPGSAVAQELLEPLTLDA